MKNSVDGFNSRMEMADDKLRKCKYRPIETIPRVNKGIVKYSFNGIPCNKTKTNKPKLQIRATNGMTHEEIM